MNITDVGHLSSDADTGEDKMLKGAKRENKTVLEIAQFYTDAFFSDCEKLNIKRPDVVEPATNCIPEFIHMVQVLLDKGFAYEAGGNVYVDTSTLKDYAYRAFKSLADTADPGLIRLRTLLVDMLNYGAAAQKQFKYKTGDPANAKLTDAQKSLATVSYEKKDHWAKTGCGYASNLELNDRITLRLWFTGVTEDMYAIATFTNHYGNAVSTRVEFSEFTLANASTKCYTVPVNDLVIADGCQAVTCRLYNGSGVEVGSCTESVQSYLKYMLETNQDTHGLYDTTMKFVTSAYKYFH
jgi:hypothetical protein